MNCSVDKESKADFLTNWQKKVEEENVRLMIEFYGESFINEYAENNLKNLLHKKFSHLIFPPSPSRRL